MEADYDILMDAADLLEASSSKRCQMRAMQIRLIAKELVARTEK